MIKNYVVSIRNNEKTNWKKFLSYLNNTEHKNHSKHNTKIVSLSSVEQFAAVTASKLDENEKRYKINGKGGKRLKVVSKSFTFNLPKSFVVDIDKMKEMNEELLKELKELYSVNGFEIDRSELYSVIHFQDNSHIHLISPYLDMNGVPMRFVKSKMFLNQTKLIWDNLITKHFNITKNQYQPLSNSQREHNEKIEWIEELIYDLVEYSKKVQNPQALKYYKNQIISLNRLIENQERITQEEIDKINKNINKINNKKSNNIKPLRTFNS